MKLLTLTMFNIFKLLSFTNVNKIWAHVKTLHFNKKKTSVKIYKKKKWYFYELSNIYTAYRICKINTFVPLEHGRYYTFVLIRCALILNQIILIIKPYTYFRQIINLIVYNCRRSIIKIKFINTNNKYMHNTVL